MPEGPEVFQLASKIRPDVLGHRLLTLTLNDGLSKGDIPVNSVVKSVETKGKKLWFVLDNGMFILFSFALEGELSSGEAVKSALSLIAELKFENDLTYYHTDHMRIAKCYYTDNLDPLLPEGIDPLKELYGMREWLEKCNQNSRRQIARFIVDQDIICGVGNIYRSEILNLSKIYPTLRLADIDQNTQEILLVNIYRVLGDASKGKYVLQVHGKKTDPYGKQVFKVRVAKSLYVWSSVIVM